VECRKCNTNIPSQFEYVISQNVCPKCGAKLMAPAAMKVYLDLKDKLATGIEFVMDKTVVCERVAMFVVSNYQIAINGEALPNTTAATTVLDDQAKAHMMKAQLAAMGADLDLSPEEIRAQEAARAAEIASAREADDTDDMLNEDEEIVTDSVNEERIRRLKKIALSSKSGFQVRRADSD
jgi:hypothetical protein